MADGCERCGRDLARETFVNVGDDGVRCFPCFNDETAARMDVAFEKMRREMAERHVVRGGHGWQLAEGDRLVGGLSWDPDPDVDDSLPLVVIDGRAFKREDVGRMQRHRDGFTVHLSVEDSIEVVGGPLLERTRDARR